MKLRMEYLFGAALIIFSVVVCALGATSAYNQFQNIPDPVKAGVDVQSGQLELSAGDAGNAVLVLAAIAVIWILFSLVRNGHGMALLVIALAAGAGAFFLLSDKTGDGVSDNQIIAVVQPVGDNPSWDSQYSDVNKENATANVITAASFGIYAVVFLVLAFGLSFLFILAKSRA